MKLNEMLEHTAESYLDDRTALIDGANDSLWSDELLCRYFNEAQRRLCRRAWVLQDIAHPDAGTIVLVTGKSVYDVHKSVLRILDATLEDDTTYLSRADDMGLRRPRPYDDSFWPDLNGVTAETGRPRVFATDTAPRKLRVYPTPRVDENGLRVTLRVVRMPVEMLDVAKPDAEPEVPEEYHLALCEYAAGKCLKQPNDGHSKALGQELVDGFEALIKEARQDITRAGMSSGRWSFSSSTARV